MDRALVLRTCRINMTVYNGFLWPDSGEVSAPDWKPSSKCGNGLHGLLWGEGDSSLLDWDDDAKWVVCSVDSELIVSLGNKVKFPKCEVVHVGDQVTATNFIRDRGGRDRAITGLTVSEGHHCVIVGGDKVNIVGRNKSKLSGVVGASIIGGEYARIEASYGADLQGGFGSWVSGGGSSNIVVGSGSIVEAGHYSNITGYDECKLSGGEYCSIVGGGGSVFSGGLNSVFVGRGWDYDGDVETTVSGKVGSNGILPRTYYRVSGSDWVKLTPEDIDKMNAECEKRMLK